MQLTEEQIEAIITKACGKYRTGDSYTFEDVWNCIEKALAAHSAGAQRQSTTLGEQIKQAEKAVANWTPERRANVRLQGSDLYAQPQPTTDNVLKVLADLRRKLAALPHRQIELALGEYQAWMLKGDALDMIDAEIERIDREGARDAS